MSPPTDNKETPAFLGAMGFWRMHIPKYSTIVSTLYLMKQKRSNFQWGLKQQLFEQINQEISHEVALGPVRTGQDVKNVLYTLSGENGPSCKL